MKFFQHANDKCLIIEATAPNLEGIIHEAIANGRQMLVDKISDPIPAILLKILANQDPNKAVKIPI